MSDILVHMYQKSWRQAVIMMMTLKESLHASMIRKTLRNARAIHGLQYAHIGNRIF